MIFIKKRLIQKLDVLDIVDFLAPKLEEASVEFYNSIGKRQEQSVDTIYDTLVSWFEEGILYFQNTNEAEWERFTVQCGRLKIEMVPDNDDDDDDEGSGIEISFYIPLYI